MNERKLNNYTVVYQPPYWVDNDTPVPVEYIHVKALTPYNAQAMVPSGRLLAVFEGQIAPVLR